MPAPIECDLCVVGAGSAGLSLAAGAAQLGLKTVLVEDTQMGGDCLNTGCIPSKSMLAVAKRVHARTTAGIGGLSAQEAAVTRAGVNAHIREAIGTIAPHDSVERFEGLGVSVLRERARFLDEARMAVGEDVVEAKTFVLATGSRAALPPLEGLDPARVLTNETVFDLDVLPEHLLILGAGPIGCEMATAHRRLGCRVTLIDQGPLLSKDDPELTAVVRDALTAEGVVLREGTGVTAVRHGQNGVELVLETRGADGAEAVVSGSHLLVAAGRRANVDDLGLEKADIAHDHHGITVDARLRTSNRRVLAIGDAAGGPQFTHVAGYHAGIVIRNLAFRLPAKVDYSALPRVTYTDPELAHVGLDLEAAREAHGDGVKSLVHPFKGLDRAVAEGRREGLLKLVAKANGKILGCSIVAPGAGELIAPWCLAISKGMKLKDLAGVVLPYPTYSEISKQAAGEWYKPQLFSDRTRSAVRWLQKLPRF